jgi:hypothetical protein
MPLKISFHIPIPANPKAIGVQRSKTFLLRVGKPLPLVTLVSKGILLNTTPVPFGLFGLFNTSKQHLS